jgi:predicted RNase H-like HicB family nuclease
MLAHLVRPPAAECLYAKPRTRTCTRQGSALTALREAASFADAMRFEVDLIQEEGGIYRATAVAYPTVTVTGRTEKEALGLLIDALDRHFKDEARKSQTRS